jgi:hypothetical protein
MSIQMAAVKLTHDDPELVVDLIVVERHNPGNYLDDSVLLHMERSKNDAPRVR